MSAGGRGRPPLRRKRTAWRPPVGDGVLDVPQIRTHLTALHHPVGEGLAPPAVYAPRPIFAPSRRGRRPRRPVCPTFYHVRGRPRAAAPTTKTNGPAPTRRGRRPRRPADSQPPHGFAPVGAAISRPRGKKTIHNKSIGRIRTSIRIRPIYIEMIETLCRSRGGNGRRSPLSGASGAQASSASRKTWAMRSA